MNLIKRHIREFSLLCDRHKVETMYLFGSALTSSFTGKSDLDFLVKFRTGEIPDYFDNYIDLKEQLGMLFGRDVDLLEEQALKNPVLIESINRSKELVYG